MYLPRIDHLFCMVLPVEIVRSINAKGVEVEVSLLSMTRIRYHNLPYLRENMNFLFIFIIGPSVLAIIWGLALASRIMKQPAGEGKVIGIAKAIQEGAKAYLVRQYKTVAPIGIILFL